MSSPKKILVSFGDSRMRASALRLKEQAKAFNLFDEIHIYDERALAPDFKKHFSAKLIRGARGFGYWCWKPQIILQVLNKIRENDLVLYLDVGCHLNINGKQRLVEYFDMLKDANNGILAFQTKPPTPPLPYDGRKLLELPDYKWIKGDLLDYFKVRNNLQLLGSGTIGAGVLLVRKTRQACGIIEQWLSVPTRDFSLIDDSPSLSPNQPGFVEHRHDQAILSILCKLNNIQTISAFEYWYPSKEDCWKPDWEMLTMFPIQARRDKVINNPAGDYPFAVFQTIKNRIRSLVRAGAKLL